MHRFSRLWLFLVLLGFAPLGECTTPASPWSSESATKEVSVHLYFFWTSTCPHCTNARPFIQDLVTQHPWIELESIELTDAESARRFVELARQADGRASSVPAFIFCGRMLTGFDGPTGVGAELLHALQKCRSALQSGVTNPGDHTSDETSIQLPGLGEFDASTLSLPFVAVLLGALDSFNPCAFFVLLFLLSMLVNAKSRSRMLWVGVLFVSVSGIAYFLFIAAWLNIFLIIGELALVTLIAGLFAVTIGLLNIKDFAWLRKGPSLSITANSKTGLLRRMRNLIAADSWMTLTLGTLALAIVANAYELLCTAGFPMIFTRMLTLHDLSAATYYGYIVLYCAVYIVPLLCIVLFFVFTLGRRKLSEYEGRLLKLLSGVMMCALGVLLLFSPELLSNVAVIASLLLVALSVTAAAYLIERSTQGRHT